MSDELRDLLKARAGDAPVPNDDLGDVIRGGKALRWRKRLYSVGVVVLVGVLSFTAIPELLSSQREDDPPPVIADTPSPDATGSCEAVPFRATYLPDGWSYKLRPGSGGFPGKYADTMPPDRLAYWAPIENTRGTYIDVMKYGIYNISRADGDQIRVLGDEGLIGRVEGGWSVNFEYGGCKYSVVTFSNTKEELSQVAESLRPTDSCNPPPVTGPDSPLSDGRHFVYIMGVNLVGQGIGIQFDRAEFLSGKEANEAAVAAGAIEEGEAVPNDYFIVNQSDRTEALGFADDVEVYIETLQDGMPGLAPADTLWLACAFAGDESHRHSPYWMTVKDQEVVKLEEVYLP